MKSLIHFSLIFIGLIGQAQGQNNFGYGLKIPTEEQIKSVPYKPSFSLPPTLNLPDKIDLSDKMPPVGNQGYQGSCAAFAVSYAMKSYQEKKQFNWAYIENGSMKNDRICSPSFVFNTVKRMTNNYNCLEGIYFAEAFDILGSIGTSWLSDFAYDEQNCSKQPNPNTIQKASVNKISTYTGVNFKNIDEIKYNLYVGNPVVIGVMLDDFFQPDGFQAFKERQHYTFIPKGILSPNNYHAMVCTGYNNQSNSFQVLNSWGGDWGNAGYVDIPYKWFSKVVLEAYTMNDAYQNLTFVAATNKETENSKSNIFQNSFFSWFGEGYYRDYKNIRIGLIRLGSSDSTVTVIFSDIANGKEIKTLTYNINVPQAFYYNQIKIKFTFTGIEEARIKPSSKVAFFNISIDNSIDIEIKEKIDKSKMLIEQKNLFDNLIKQQNMLLNN